MELNGKPLFVTIPHSGEQVPDFCDWLKNLPEPVLMRDVDRFVDVLYQPALQKLKIPLVKTLWHRYAADLNRIPEDVDSSSVIENKNPAGMHNRGFHWTVTTFAEPLMTKPMPMKMHKELVELVYRPFHQSVRAQYEMFHQSGFKEIYHIDAHSMPSVGTKMHKDPGEYRADIVISDCGGKSCKKWFLDLVVSSYESAGFKVRVNWPYIGGRVSEQYGQPSVGHHAIQVEMNRALYMNEETKKLKPEHGEIQSKVQIALAEILAKLS
jgi:N-formylglutamate deformylase